MGLKLFQKFGLMAKCVNFYKNLLLLDAKVKDVD